jgi:antitoxin (DNA-binding transcriptional repressor) of toxin-antitoxin stability system
MAAMSVNSRNPKIEAIARLRTLHPADQACCGASRRRGPPWTMTNSYAGIPECRRGRVLLRLDLVHFMIYSGTMIKLNIHEAKTHLSKYLAKLKAGDRILLCKRNHPIAEITALPEPPAQSRPIGLAKGRFSVPRSFFDPLPNELLDAFEGTHG